MKCGRAARQQRVSPWSRRSARDRVASRPPQVGDQSLSVFLVLTTFLGTMSAARYFRMTRAVHWPKFILHRVLRTWPMLAGASTLLSVFNSKP